ncbi:MAG: hypothetical protein JXR53_13670 [Bacteroidales bacterium]|nr:hypothetical protein [Bacteroidales bacterium]
MPGRTNIINTPPIKEFPAGMWRIAWFGRIERNIDIPSEPTIEVFIKSVTPNPDVKVIKIGVGQLPLLKIGSHWENGIQSDVVHPYVETIELKNINVNSNTVTKIEAWDKLDSYRYIINPKHIRIPKTAARSDCLAIEYNGDKYGLIIPAAEIARFYYCSSTDLAHAAFWGHYITDLDTIINPQKSGFDKETDKAIIHLRQRFSDLDAWTIARIQQSDIAKIGVNSIHNSLVKNMNTEKAGLFECGLPFTGETRWLAKCIEVGDDDNKRYLIIELLKCSAPFPFTNLQVDRDNNATKANPETDSSAKAKKIYNRTRTDKKPLNAGETKPLNSQSETDKTIEIANILAHAPQFDFLEGKEIIKPEMKEFTKYKSVPNSVKNKKKLTGTGTGKGNQKKGSTNAPAQVNSSKSVGADLQMLIDAVELLKKDSTLKVSMRPIGCIPLSKAQNRAQWAYFDSALKIRRRYIALDIKVDAKHYVWIEIEQRRKGECTVGLLKTDELIADTTLQHILKNLSRLKGIWEGSNGNVVDGSGIMLERVLHTWNSIQKLSSIIRQKTSSV